MYLFCVEFKQSTAIKRLVDSFVWTKFVGVVWKGAEGRWLQRERWKWKITSGCKCCPSTSPFPLIDWFGMVKRDYSYFSLFSSLNKARRREQGRPTKVDKVVRSRVVLTSRSQTVLTDIDCPLLLYTIPVLYYSCFSCEYWFICLILPECCSAWILKLDSSPSNSVKFRNSYWSKRKDRLICYLCSVVVAIEKNCVWRTEPFCIN